MFKLISAASESLGTIMRRFLPTAVLLAIAAAIAMTAEARAAQNPANTVTCTSGKLSPQNLRAGGGSLPGRQPDLVVSTRCTVSSPGNYFYGNVNIVAGGILIFTEPQGTGTRVNFW